MTASRRFSDELRHKAAHIWDEEKRHPFVLGIGDGGLPLEKFRYYMSQDYVFLIDYSRVIAIAASKAERLEDMAWFARLLHETLNTEMALHVSYCQEFGITESELESTQPSPTTLAYTRHMLESATMGTVGDAAAAILPCSWGYAEIGRALHNKGIPEDNPLYSRWIEMYSSTEFAELAEWLRSFIDRMAGVTGEKGRRKMERIFVTSSRYEYMFWEAANKMEQWPV